VGNCRWQGFEVVDGGVCARCSCGWRSPASGTAEEAGRLSDEHRAAAQDLTA
jgi:hypothetical protein